MSTVTQNRLLICTIFFVIFFQTEEFKAKDIKHNKEKNVMTGRWASYKEGCASWARLSKIPALVKAQWNRKSPVPVCKPRLKKEFLSALPFSYLFFLFLAIPPAYRTQWPWTLECHPQLCGLTQRVFQVTRSWGLHASLRRIITLTHVHFWHGFRVGDKGPQW